MEGFCSTLVKYFFFKTVFLIILNSGDQHGVTPSHEYYMSDLKNMIDERHLFFFRFYFSSILFVFL